VDGGGFHGGWTNKTTTLVEGFVFVVFYQNDAFL
jgi:hypothetical protein